MHRVAGKDVEAAQDVDAEESNIAVLVSRPRAARKRDVKGVVLWDVHRILVFPKERLETKVRV